MDADAALAQRTLPGEGPIAVLGSGETALNAAAFCAEEGREVTLVTGGEPLGADMNPLLAAKIEAYLAERGVTVVDSHDAPAGAAALWAPAREVAPPLAEPPDGIPVIAVGTRARPGRLYEATQSAFWTASRL